MTKEIKVIGGGMYSGFVEMPIHERPKQTLKKKKKLPVMGLDFLPLKDFDEIIRRNNDKE